MRKINLCLLFERIHSYYVRYKHYKRKYRKHVKKVPRKQRNHLLQVFATQGGAPPHRRPKRPSRVPSGGDRRPLDCLRCGSTAHLARDCTLPRTDNGARGGSSSRPGQSSFAIQAAPTNQGPLLGFINASNPSNNGISGNFMFNYVTEERTESSVATPLELEDARPQFQDAEESVTSLPPTTEQVQNLHQVTSDSWMFRQALHMPCTMPQWMRNQRIPWNDVR